MFHQLGNYVAEWQMKKEYFIQRKAWAREILEKNGLKNPGQSTTATFNGLTYTITIGPRGRIQITGNVPWQLNWRWFRDMRDRGIHNMHVADWFAA
jgi:hypothetical protein